MPESYERINVSEARRGQHIELYLIASNEGWEWCRCTVLSRLDEPLHIRFTDGTEKRFGFGANPMARREAPDA